MQGVPELVEQRPRIVEAQKRRSALPSFREIQDVHDDGGSLPVEPLLPAKTAHPSAASL
jgi:hypothetical protein